MATLEYIKDTKKGDPIYHFWGGLDNPDVRPLPQGAWLIDATDPMCKGKYAGITAAGTIWICWWREGDDNEERWNTLVSRYNSMFSPDAKAAKVFGEVRSAAQQNDLVRLATKTEVLKDIKPNAGEVYYAEREMSRIANLPCKKGVARILLKDNCEST